MIRFTWPDLALRARIQPAPRTVFTLYDPESFAAGSEFEKRLATLHDLQYPILSEPLTASEWGVGSTPVTGADLIPAAWHDLQYPDLSPHALVRWSGK
jgi:hypothetical protein